MIWAGENHFRRMEMATDCDYAWAAGFIDGEGTIRASTNPHTYADGGQVMRACLYLSAAQKFDPPLRRLHAILGAGSIYHYTPKTRNPFYVFSCGGRAAFASVDAIWPWLGEQKKADCKRALATIRDCRANKPLVATRACVGCGAPFTPSRMGARTSGRVAQYCSKRCWERTNRRRRSYGPLQEQRLDGFGLEQNTSQNHKGT
jgi:hypothetical protein